MILTKPGRRWRRNHWLLPPEQIKRATMHSTNKAFERYFQVQTEDIVKMYQKTADTVLIRKITPIKKGKLPK